MKPSALRNVIPELTGDAQGDVKKLSLALHDILRLLDDFSPLVASGGNILVGNRTLSEDAKRGFLYIPAIDGEEPTGTPADYGAGDPIVRTQENNKLWAYDFEAAEWVEIPTADDDQEILELLLLILGELELHRKFGL